MSTPAPPINPDVFDAFLLGQLNEEQAKLLDQHLRDHPEALEQLAQAMQLMSMVRHEFAGREQYQAVNKQEPLLQDFNQLLKELGEFEANAPVVTQSIEPSLKLKSQRKTDVLSLHEFASAGQYVLGKVLTAKATIFAAAAAVVLLATVIFVDWGGLEVEDIAQTPPVTDTPSQAESPAVATLTATHNAKWDSKPVGDARRGDALHPGTRLHPGQRLTLTQGLAEITTLRGAIAIIEAPATIELIDSPNALRLHAGKLVGICETESSKGFLVRTPHLDITDLGTRFGVSVLPYQASEVHVFEGEVQVDRSATTTQPPLRQVLVTGQATLANQDEADALLVMPAEPDRFAQDTGVQRVADTGGGLSPGDVDPDWQVIAVDGQAPTEHDELTVWAHPDNSLNREGSKWVRINKALNPSDQKSVVFTCQTSFELSDDLDFAAHELIIRCRADYAIQALRINGHALTVNRNRIGDGPMWLTWTLTDHFVTGTNEIEVEVFERLPKDKPANTSGLRAEIELHTREST